MEIIVDFTSEKSKILNFRMEGSLFKELVLDNWINKFEIKREFIDRIELNTIDQESGFCLNDSFIILIDGTKILFEPRFLDQVMSSFIPKPLEGYELLSYRTWQREFEKFDVDNVEIWIIVIKTRKIENSNDIYGILIDIIKYFENKIDAPLSKKQLERHMEDVKLNNKLIFISNRKSVISSQILNNKKYTDR